MYIHLCINESMNGCLVPGSYQLAEGSNISTVVLFSNYSTVLLYALNSAVRDPGLGYQRMDVALYSININTQ